MLRLEFLLHSGGGNLGAQCQWREPEQVDRCDIVFILLVEKDLSFQ